MATYNPFSSYNPDVTLDFIRNEEGCELRSYLCPAGRWTIGYGHTAGVTEGMTISQAHAEDLLRSDVIDCAQRMSSYIKTKVTKWQFIALVSLSFNVGDLRRKAPKLLHYLNAGQEDKAAHEFLDIVKAGGVPSKGLKTRREKEAKMFLRTEA
nr:MAG TPA: Lysozyme [Caudoviricetes sp.]